MANVFSTTEWNSHLEIVFLDSASANALGLPAARELRALVKGYRRWAKPVVVRSAHPRVFCSGGQLADYAKLKGRAPGLKINREITSVLDAFGKWPVVKLAVVEGDVFGGGMEWLARFDYRWSVPSALFGFWQKRIGLSTGWGGGRAWSAKIGEDRVRQLLMEARLLSAVEAQRLGLLDRVVTRWSLKDEMDAWARGMMARSADSNARGGGPGADTSLVGWSAKNEVKVFSKLWMGPAHQAVLKRWK